MSLIETLKDENVSDAELAESDPPTEEASDVWDDADGDEVDE